MSLKEVLDEALDAHEGSGEVHAADGEHSATLDVEQVGPIGIRIRKLCVKRPPLDVGEAAEAYPERMRALGEPLKPIEIDRRLGGTTLRTKPESMRNGEFFDVEVRSDGQTGIRRLKVDEAGDRREIPWSMTRDQLGRLLDDLDEDES